MLESEAVVAGNELLPTVPGVGEAVPAPHSEIYGFYAPPGPVPSAVSGGEKRAAVAVQSEVYGAFAPYKAPRAGDVVVAPPGA